MTAAKITSNGELVVRALSAREARMRDLTEPMKLGAEALYLVARDAIDGAASPSGAAWEPLSDVTIAMRKRGGGDVRPLQGDTNQLVGTLFARGAKDRIAFGAKALSRKGFPYWLAQLFGSTREGTYKRSTYESAEGENRMSGPLRPGQTRQMSGRAKRVHSAGDPFVVRTPARPFFPVVEDASGRLAAMAGGAADRLYAKIRRYIARYIKDTKAGNGDA